MAAVDRAADHAEHAGRSWRRACPPKLGRCPMSEGGRWRTTGGSTERGKKAPAAASEGRREPPRRGGPSAQRGGERERGSTERSQKAPAAASEGRREPPRRGGPSAQRGGEWERGSTERSQNSACGRKRGPEGTAATRRPERAARWRTKRGSTERSRIMERYRSGRNGGASKASCRESGTWVRIPPSPPTFAERSLRSRLPPSLKLRCGSSPSSAEPFQPNHQTRARVCYA